MDCASEIVDVRTLSLQQRCNLAIIESRAPIRMIHHERGGLVQERASRVERRLGTAEHAEFRQQAMYMTLDRLFSDSQLSRDGKNMALHDLLCKVRPAALTRRTREYPTF